jgi:guanyl-specific ribonuclease Sa
MKKLKLPLLLSSLLLFGLGPVFAAPEAPAYALISELGSIPSFEIVVSTPLAVEDGSLRYVKPPCLTSPALTPGKAFLPVVSDARRVRAIEDLLARLAVCKTMPYDNDGNVHSKPHEGLPAKPSGYYLEYTLIVPNRPTGSKPEPVVIGGQTYMTGPVQSARGPERLMIGNHSEVYYTPDHYTTFIHLDIVR